MHEQYIYTFTSHMRMVLNYKLLFDDCGRAAYVAPPPTVVMVRRAIAKHHATYVKVRMMNYILIYFFSVCVVHPNVLTHHTIKHTLMHAGTCECGYIVLSVWFVWFCVCTGGSIIDVSAWHVVFLEKNSMHLKNSMHHRIYSSSVIWNV